MNTYELQVYQNGGWQFDSYYDSKDLVLSEAEITKAREGSSGERNSMARWVNPPVAMGPVRSVKARSGGYCSENPSTGST